MAGYLDGIGAGGWYAPTSVVTLYTGAFVAWFRPDTAQLAVPAPLPNILSVSTDDIVPDTEDPWNITGTRFGVR